ncbi:hypothetical protein SYNPS1DRAFT_30386 [Syncephalis pseudoplumigaleata]|uniref:Uncharacterized protein n=1 Tax=Syncephalis pseudoplumigaleata TaxID=1712513 RepID=A0A4P9YX17_9FUNG|nr:hypothetical protein SYNPS1DRAFT_30386 [Syncephalis pseudoplumigaleata]|eukprot:RKP23851.1 hypothetical protein SYNPS1DRAFT_30386 [Syncephalis pseudoplumigaleata]
MLLINNAASSMAIAVLLALALLGHMVDALAADEWREHAMQQQPGLTLTSAAVAGRAYIGIGKYELHYMAEPIPVKLICGNARSTNVQYRLMHIGKALSVGLGELQTGGWGQDAINHMNSAFFEFLGILYARYSGLDERVSTEKMWRIFADLAIS